MKKQIIMSVFGAFLTFAINAQDANQTTFNPAAGQKASPTEEVMPEPKINTVMDQFQILIDKGGSWQNYKMFDKVKLAHFRQSLSDTLKNIRTRLQTEKQTVKKHEEEINKLNGDIATLQASLDQTHNEKDSMNFFGILLPKGAYNAIMWGIVLVLAILFILYVYKFSNSNVVTRKSIRELAELQEEYESYRKAAIDREQKVRRQLQDEINKHR